jgi:hypothetical protein
MEQEPQTFPTLRSWRRMSERQQDALLDRIESRQRWRILRSRMLVALLCAATLAVVAALLVTA